MPFAECVVVFGEPFYVPESEAEEQLAESLAARLDGAMKKAAEILKNG